ncbi:hypothetical protein GW813_08550, partial [bacterium]|nr:hypothetical protein [bacterium]
MTEREIPGMVSSSIVNRKGKAMKYLLLGAGLQGTAIAWDLLHNAQGTTQMVVCDGNADALGKLAARLADARLQTVAGDVTDAELVHRLMSAAQVTVSAVNYWYNADLAAKAVAAGCHFLDLGGNNDIVAREFALTDQAAAADVAVIPDCGLAPGLAGILGHHLAVSLNRCENLRLRV